MMTFFRNVLLFIFVLQVSHASDDGSTYKSYKGYVMYEVEGPMADLMKMRESFYTHSIPYFEINKSTRKAQILVPSELRHGFEILTETFNFKKTIAVEDISTLMSAELLCALGRKPFSFNCYHSNEDINAYLYDIHATYPNWTGLDTIGWTYENRPILCLSICTTKEHKCAIVLESGCHAREWICPAAILYLINQLLTSTDPDIVNMRDSFCFYFIVVLNPDGYHYSYTSDRLWRKNRSKPLNGCYGTDINRNFPYNWGNYSSSPDPCDFQVYQGSQPSSENETRALIAYVCQIKNLKGYIAFHSDGNMVLFPYSDAAPPVENESDLITVGKAMIAAAKAKYNASNYGGPNTADKILYAASGTSMDYFYSKCNNKTLMFTIECRGLYYFFWPAVLIYQIAEEVIQMVLAFTKVGRDLGYFVDCCN